MNAIDDLHKIIPLKCWFILREDITYSYDRILNLGIRSISLKFNREELRDEWVKYGSKIETFMSFNIGYIEKIEEILIENGVLFKWIYDGKTPLGILIEPSRFYFKSPILDGYMTLKEYSKNRMHQMESIKIEYIEKD